MTIFIIIFILLLVIAIRALNYAWHHVQAIKDYSLIDGDRVGCSQSIGFIGCSVVCSGIVEREQIAHLLGQEYERYEVIIAMDATIHAEVLHEIISHYRMVSVNCTPTLELPITVRHLYRSRQRSYRRLIVVDVPQRSVYDDWNAGVMVSSYDYILPISNGMALYDRAIENLAIALCSSSPHPIEVLRSSTSPATIINRRMIINTGGFSSHVGQSLARMRVITTRVPVTYHTTHAGKIFSTRMTIIALIITLVIATSATYDPRIAISIALTMVMLSSAARWVAVVSQPKKCSVRDILYHFKQIVNIFPSRKFMVW